MIMSFGSSPVNNQTVAEQSVGSLRCHISIDLDVKDGYQPRHFRLVPALTLFIAFGQSRFAAAYGCSVTGVGHSSGTKK